MSRILVVEDDHDFAETLSETLRELGYEVPAVASRGEEALALATDHAVDLALMDIHLHGTMDGVMAAGELRRRCDLPVIFVTAHADDETIARARVAEPRGYLTKPFNRRELRGAIEVALYRQGMDTQLRDRARRLESVLGSMGEAVITADEQGRVTHLNPAAEALTGWSVGEGLGRLLAEVCTIEPVLDDGPPLSPATARQTSSRVRSHSVLVKRDGRRIPIEAEIAPAQEEGEAVHGLVAVLRDVSAERDQQERVALSERLATISVMANGISNELNNPLAYLIANLGFAEENLALMAGDDDPAQPKTLERATSLERIEQARLSLAAASAGAQRLRRVIGELRAFTDPSAILDGELDLGSILVTAALVARPVVELRARLRVHADALPHVRGNRPRLVQAFSNLMMSAVHSVIPGNVEDNEVVVRARADPSKRVVIEVSDSGVPMGPHAHRHLFDPFFIRHGGRSSEGLGMWIAHRVLSDHGATIRLESRADRGNRLTVMLPLAPPEKATEAC